MAPFAAVRLNVACGAPCTAANRSSLNATTLSCVGSVVTTDPTQLNVVALSDDLFAAVQGAPQATFSLTAAKGAMITLPNGQVVEKAFRGIAESQAERFGQVVRNGLLTGETTPSIARRLIGSLQFGEEARTVRQLIAAGGELTAVADNQVVALVRTSINQVANAASQQMYQANPDITKKYRYIATLDSRTSAICRALDGREFEYGKGPTPPQHFNCLPGFAHVSTSGRIAAVYRRLYEGSLYVIKASNGHMLRVTPNHPVLTSNGWKPANLVQIGDKVFTSNVIPPKAIADNKKHHAVATAEDIFRAFRESPAVFSVEVPTTAPDFHGDASIAESAKQVAVVLADRELLLAVNPGLLKALLDFSFKRANPAASSSSHLEHGLLAVGNTSLRGMGGRGESLPLISGSACHAGELLLAPVPQLATGFQDDPLYGTWRDAESIRDALNADALVEQGYDQADVCWIGWLPFSGHVYNFETEGGTYCADAILTHNCRSTTVAVVDYEGLGFEPPPPGKRASMGGQVPADMTYGEWLSKQPRSVQEDVLGAKTRYFPAIVRNDTNKFIKQGVKPDTARKRAARDAMAKLVRDDGSELTLDDLRKRYGPAQP